MQINNSAVFTLRVGWFDPMLSLFLSQHSLNISIYFTFVYMRLQAATSWVGDKIMSGYANFSLSPISLFSFKKMHVFWFLSLIHAFSYFPLEITRFLHFPALVYSSDLHPSRESIKSPDAALCLLLGRSRVQSCYMAPKYRRHVSLPQAL